MILYSCGRSDSSSLLTKLSHVETDSALALGLVEDNISLIHHNHCPEHLLKGCIIDFRLVCLIDYVSFLIKNAEAPNLIESTPELEVICELLLEHVRVDLIHSTESPGCDGC